MTQPFHTPLPSSSTLSSPLEYPVSQTALLLLDYHTMITNRFDSAAMEPVMATAAAMRDWARSMGIVTLHCLIDFSLPCPPQARMADRLGGMQKILAEKPEIADEDPRIAPHASEDDDHESPEITFTRIPGTVSAMTSAGIQEFLKTRGIKSLIMCGLSTSGCLLSTARNAADLGYVVTVVEDACCDPVQGVHEVLVKHVLPMQGFVVGAQEFKKEWEGKRSGTV